MAEMRRYWFIHHLRSEQNAHVLVYREGKLVKSGRGLAFWFLPMKASIAEVPVDNRELTFLFHGRSSDHQTTVVQGTLTWRVACPELLAQPPHVGSGLISRGRKMRCQPTFWSYRLRRGCASAKVLKRRAVLR